MEDIYTKIFIINFDWINHLSRTTKLSIDLARFDTGNDQSFLSKLVKNIFQRYLDSYTSLEVRSMKERNALLLKKFYESKNHQKRVINTGGIQELRRVKYNTLYFIRLDYMIIR